MTNDGYNVLDPELFSYWRTFLKCFIKLESSLCYLQDISLDDGVSYRTEYKNIQGVGVDGNYSKGFCELIKQHCERITLSDQRTTR